MKNLPLNGSTENFNLKGSQENPDNLSPKKMQINSKKQKCFQCLPFILYF